MSLTLEARLAEYLRLPDRHVGGPGNRAATDLFEQVAREAGWEVDRAELPCLEWSSGLSVVEVRGETIVLHAGPYSRPCAVTAPLTTASSVEEIERGDHAGAILLLDGEVAREQLAPKNFAFYNPASHARIVAAIESSGAVAVLAATGIDPGLAGGLSPFPLIEDGDFDLPNAYLSEHAGARARAHAGERANLRIDSARRPAVAVQPVARKAGTGDGRIVVFAHIDSKDGSPGALDNATGVTALLGVLELLADRAPYLSVEVVPLNGEDYYAATGQMHWLTANEGRMGDIVLGVNVDGAGLAGAATAVSRYGLDDRAGAVVDAAVAGRSGFAEGPQWPQGDHSLLTMHGVPAVAVTSEDVFFVATTIAHTARDVAELVDVAAVAEVSRFIDAVVRGFDVEQGGRR